MILMRFLALILFLFFPITLRGEALDTIRKQFEIYQRQVGEMEILLTSNEQEIDRVLKRTESKRQAARNALDNAASDTSSTTCICCRLPSALCCLSYLSPLFTEEYTAPILHYVAIEQTLAKRSLDQGKPEETMQSIHFIYQLAWELADTGSLKLRLAASRIRLQTLETVQSFLLSPYCRKEHQKELYDIFNNLIQSRQADQSIWTLYGKEGERFFEELSRRGLSKMISPNILKELKDRHALDGYETLPAERFTHDVTVFRQVIPMMIEASALPYYKRAPLLQRMDKWLKGQQGTKSESIFTILLLFHVAESMRILIQEQSGNELAYLALSVAVLGEHQHGAVNFLTGNEYEISLITDGVMCTYKGNITPFYVSYR